MGKKEEKNNLKKLKNLVKESQQERYERVTSGKEPKATIIPNKKRKKLEEARSKERD